METFQFVRLIFRSEAPVLLREVIHDVFLCWLSWELASVAVIALYLCQAHTFVLMLSKDVAFNKRWRNPISVARKYYLCLEWKGRVRKHTRVLTIKK